MDHKDKKFQHGGIIKGSLTGDKTPFLATPEFLMTRRQINELRKVIGQYPIAGLKDSVIYNEIDIKEIIARHGKTKSAITK